MRLGIERDCSVKDRQNPPGRVIGGHAPGAYLDEPRSDCISERDGKTNHNQHYHKADGPVWNFKKWKDLRRNLHQQPCDDCVRDRNFVHVAPLQLGEDVLSGSLCAP
jgi:hypothetical protein